MGDGLAGHVRIDLAESRHLGDRGENRTDRARCGPAALHDKLTVDAEPLGHHIRG